MHSPSEHPQCMCDSCFKVRVLIDLEALRDDVRIIRDRDTKEVRDAIAAVGTNLDNNFQPPEK